MTRYHRRVSVESGLPHGILSNCPLRGGVITRSAIVVYIWSLDDHTEQYRTVLKWDNITQQHYSVCEEF